MPHFDRLDPMAHQGQRSKRGGNCRCRACDEHVLVWRCRLAVVVVSECVRRSFHQLRGQQQQLHGPVAPDDRWEQRTLSIAKLQKCGCPGVEPPEPDRREVGWDRRS